MRYVAPNLRFAPVAKQDVKTIRHASALVPIVNASAKMLQVAFAQNVIRSK